MQNILEIQRREEVSLGQDLSVARLSGISGDRPVCNDPEKCWWLSGMESALIPGMAGSME